MNYAKQYIDSEDVQAVAAAVRSDYLTQGPFVDRLEVAICDYLNAPYCAVVSSGTAALHLAVKVLKQFYSGIHSGATSANTFVASANCMRYNHVHPEFIDINLNDYQMGQEVPPDVQLLIWVHFAGIATIPPKAEYVIEDACHAFGAMYPDGEKVGCGKYSQMTCFSFHPAKTITTGEGGAVVSRNKDYIDEIKRLRNHGTENVGYNYRMTEMQAALGLSQIRKADKFVERRREIFRYYNEQFGGVFKTPAYDQYSSCNLYVGWFDVPSGDLEKSHANWASDNMVVLERLQKDHGIIAQLHYIPTYRQRWYDRHYKDFCPNAEEYSRHALSLPLYPAMTDEDVEFVIKAVRQCI